MPGGVSSAPEHLPPPLPKIKRPQEDIDKSTDRLNRPHKVPEAKDEHMLSPRVVKPARDIEVSINRLYTQAVDKDKKRKEMAASQEAQPLSSTMTKQVSEEEIAEGVTHLYFRAVEQKRATTAKGKERYQFVPPKSPRVDQAATSARVYTAALEKRKKEHDKLQNRYIDQTMPKYRKLSAAEVKASGERLSTVK